MRIKLVALVVVGFGLLASATSSEASTISQILQPGTNFLSDNSAEILIDAPGCLASTPTGNQCGRLDVGDRLRGIYGWNTIENSSGTTDIGASSPHSELTGIFDITVATKVQDGTFGLIPIFDFTFSPTPVATSGFGALGAPVGTASLMFEDSAHEYSRLTADGCTSSAPGGTCEGLITDGTGFWYFGDGVGPSGYFWAANNVADDPAVAGLIAAGSGGGQFFVGLERLPGGTGPLLGLVNDCANGVTGTLVNVNLCSNGNLVSPLAGSTPYQVWDNLDATIFVAVPAPAALLLVGFGLVGMAVRGWRRS